jgi:hypothetical protein
LRSPRLKTISLREMGVADVPVLETPTGPVDKPAKRMAQMCVASVWKLG